MDTKTPFYYKVFGLAVQSVFELPELISIDRPSIVNIYIKYGEVLGPPIEISEERLAKSAIFFSPNFYYLNMGHIAKVLLIHDKFSTITIDLYMEEHANSMLAWLYGSVLTAALQLHNRFALHASAVQVDGKLSLFCGHSGIGKSTLAVQLGNRGYPLFSDDKCVLNWNEAIRLYEAQPSLQIVRLWEDATDKLGEQEIFDNPTPVVNKLDKFQYIINEENVMRDPVPIDRIHIILNSEEEEIRINELTGMKKIKAIQTQTHRKNYINGLGKTKVYWEFMDHLVKQVPVFVVRRPNGTPIEKWVDFMQHQIDKK